MIWSLALCLLFYLGGVSSIAQASNAVVSIPKNDSEGKAWLYQVPKECPEDKKPCKWRKQAYLLDGDRVRIGPHAFVTPQSGFFLVEFKGKKLSRGWLKASYLKIENSGEKSSVFEFLVDELNKKVKIPIELPKRLVGDYTLWPEIDEAASNHYHIHVSVIEVPNSDEDDDAEDKILGFDKNGNYRGMPGEDFADLFAVKKGTSFKYFNDQIILVKTCDDKKFFDPKSAKVEKVKLSNGLVATYLPGDCGASCSPDLMGWERNEVCYFISAKVSRPEMIKMAESVVSIGNR